MPVRQMFLIEQAAKKLRTGKKTDLPGPQFFLFLIYRLRKDFVVLLKRIVYNKEEKMDNSHR